MVLVHQIKRLAESAQTWIALGVLAPLGMLLVSTAMLEDMRREAWSKADKTSTNLVQVLKRDIERNIEVIDLSLHGAIENLNAPGVSAVSPELRQLILFDRAATARDIGAMFLLDEKGNIVMDSRSVPPRTQNYADREYFKAHKARAGLGLLITGPHVSRLTGNDMIALTRRIDKPDGSFGGIALATLNLSYFSRLCDQIGVGRQGVISLFMRNGARIMRYPRDDAKVGVNLANAPGFQRFVREKTGSFATVSAVDGVERLYAFTEVADSQLVLDVGLATKEIEAAWRTKAIVIGTVVLTLCGLAIVLSLMFGRELRRRTAMQAELAHLSRTDALTGLANRRRFEDAFDPAWKSARRTQQPVSLLIVDADHFKRFNDLYGHAVGDQVLQALARCLSAAVERPLDLVCRAGGEEFAVLLPETGLLGAFQMADRIHQAVANVTLASAIRAGSLTVSIGLATDRGHMSSAEELYRLADTALYAAKTAGRNQTRCAATPGLAEEAPASEAGWRAAG